MAPKQRVNVASDNSITLENYGVGDIMTALSASEGIAINFQISFAPNSSVLTADGDFQVASIAKAITYVGTDIDFELQVYGNNKTLSRSRVGQILSLLNGRFGLVNKFNVVYRPAQGKTNGNKKSNMLVKLINRGIYPVDDVMLTDTQ